MSLTEEIVEQLPTTAYAVLGMLSFGEMSGYDLMKAIDASVGLFWTPAKSQVYSELRRLVQVGYATEQEVGQRGRPDKRVHRMTDAGRRALGDWLGDTDVEPEQFKSTFLLKVFFRDRMDPNTLREQVLAARARAQSNLDRLRAVEAQITGHPSLSGPHLTLRFGLAHAQATVNWCDETLRDIKRAGKR